MIKENKSEIVSKALVLLKEANDKGITNYRISQDTKLTEPSLGNWVKGVTRPTLANAKILIDYFTGSTAKNQASDPQAPYVTNSGDIITMPREVWEVIQKQINDTTRMIDMLQQELDRYKERESQSKAG